MKFILSICLLVLTSCASIQEQCQTETWKEQKWNSEQQCVDYKVAQSQLEAQQNARLANSLQGMAQSINQQQIQQQQNAPMHQPVPTVDYSCLNECKRKGRAYQLCEKQCSY